MSLPVLDQAGLASKKIFVRGDIDVPLKHGEVADDWRLQTIWPTIDFLLKQNCQVIVAGHLGRPGGTIKPELSSQPVASWLKKQIGNFPTPDVSATTLGNFRAYSVVQKLTVLENLRFDPGEEGNDADFAQQLADLAQVYVDEAFATVEREHASIVGVPKLLPHYAGFRLAKELAVLGGLLSNPKRPLVAIIAGAKLETKIPVITKMAQVADNVIVGGKLLAELADQPQIANNSKVKLLQLSADQKDTTLNSVDACQKILASAATIVWNGPLGIVEDLTYQVGTRRLAELITSNQKAYRVVGGGDTIGFLDKLGLTDKFDWVSSGGGSMLKLLAGEKLPGVEVLLT